MEGKKFLILFDGVCHLCNRSVQFILQRDKNDRFVFASLQGDTGQRMLKKFNLSSRTFDSFVLIEGEQCYLKSTAVLRTCRYLGGLYPALNALSIIPVFIRDKVYDVIARNRYKWFGREKCLLGERKWAGKLIG